MVGLGSRLRSARCATMWTRLQQHYNEQQTPVQIQSLPLTVIKQKGKSPKLRANNAITTNTMFLCLCGFGYWVR